MWDIIFYVEGPETWWVGWYFIKVIHDTMHTYTSQNHNLTISQ